MEKDFSEQQDSEDLDLEFVNDKVDALINVLVKRGVIQEDDMQKEYDDMWEEDDSDESNEEEGDSEDDSEEEKDF